MKKNQISSLIVSVLLIVFSSCNKPLPQLPSNKGNIADENVAKLLIINQSLAIKEDSILNQFTKKDAAFKKNELGFWYKIDQTTNGQSLKDKDLCKFTCKILLLNGKVLSDDDKQIIIGKKQVVMGLEEGLKLMHKGENATFIIPWYLGYGMKGNEPLVPPYTSLIYNIKLHK